MIRFIRGFFSTLLISLVRVYQVAIAPILPTVCRFQPTCSHYFIEAVKIHGPWKGTLKGLHRIWRCRPGVPGGYDPP